MTEHTNPEHLKSVAKEGVLIHGLYLDGGGWDRVEKCLKEPEPKRLFTPLPIMHVTASHKPKKAGNHDYGPYGG